MDFENSFTKLGFFKRQGIAYLAMTTLSFIAFQSHANNEWLSVIAFNLVDKSQNAVEVSPVDDQAVTAWSESIAIDVTANDGQSDTYLPQLTTLPHHGQAKVLDNKIIYTPNSEYIGSDSLSYKLVSADGSYINSSYASVSITVNDIDRGAAPTAQDDILVTTGETKAYYIDVVTNDSDPDSDTLTIQSYTLPSNGTVVKESNTVISYTPNLDYCSTDSFSYTIEDEFKNIAQATVNISCDNSYVPPPSIPKILVAKIEVNSALRQMQTFDVVKTEYASDEKFANSQLKIVLDDPSTPGLALPSDDDVARILNGRQDTYSKKGSQFDLINVNRGRYPDRYKGDIIYYTYLQDNEAAGVIEEVHYKLVNPDGQFSEEWGLLRVSLDDAFDQNYNYIPKNDQTITAQGVAIDIDVLANDPNSQPYYQVVLHAYPSNGKLTINDDKMTFHYQPNAGFAGTDSFKYKVISQFDDDGIVSAPATVTVTVTGQNQAPIAVDDQMDVGMNSTGTTFDVIANDTDAENDFIYLLSVGNATHGTVTQHSNRAVKYVPNGSCQADTFTYVVSQDQRGTLSDTGKVTVSCIDDSIPQAFVVPVNTQPNNSITMTWQAPIKTGVAQYQVLGELKGILTEQAFTADSQGIYSYTRPALTEGREYCYKVRAKFTDGSYGNETETLCTVVSSSGQPLFDAPEPLTFTQESTQQTRIAWSSVAGAQKYLLELQTVASTTEAEGNQWQPVYFGAENQQIVQFSAFHQAIYNNLGRLTYRVSACNAQGLCGNYAREPLKTLTATNFLATVPAAHKLPACIDVPSQVSAGQIIPVSFCPTQSLDTASYDLYGELAGVIKSGKEADFARTAQGLLLERRPSLPEGREYCYKLAAIDKQGSQSAYTEKLCALVGTLAYPEPQEFIHRFTQTTPNNVDLLWLAVDGADHYQLEQQTTIGEWQSVVCTITTTSHNGVDYQGCNIDISEADILPEIGKAVYRVSACNASNVCGNYVRENVALGEKIRMTTELLSKPRGANILGGGN
ncbi:Ig-like domain-containing protein [Thalassotalea ganghwensis]